MLTVRVLPGKKRAGAPSEQQARRFAGAEKVKACKEAVRIVPLDHPSPTWGGMAAAAEHDDGIGLGGLESGTALPGRLKPAPEALANQPHGRKPEKHDRGDHRPTPVSNQAD